MKRFLRNTLIFIAIFWVLNLAPMAFLSPYYGNKWYATKYRYFRQHHQRFNAAIWGSSRTDRQVNPAVFNDVLHDKNISLFNFGSRGTFNPEVYYLYEEFLNSVEKHPIRYAFIELQPRSDTGGRDRYATKNLYWKDLDYLQYSIGYDLSSDTGLTGKTRLVLGQLSSYTARFLYGWKSLVSSRRESRDRRWVGRNGDGFCSLDALMEITGGNRSLTRRQMQLRENPTLLEDRIAEAEMAFSGKHDQPVNEAHFEKLMELIEVSRKKGIYLVYFIPSRLSGRYEEVLALKERLPERHVIEVANPKKYPELYQLEFSFDRGHLNKEGADIYTEYLAGELRKHVFTDCATEDRPEEFSR